MTTENLIKLRAIVAKMSPEQRKAHYKKVEGLITKDKTTSPSPEKKLTQTEQEELTINGNGEPLYFAKLPPNCLCGGPVTPYFPSTVNTPAEREAYLTLNYTCATAEKKSENNDHTQEADSPTAQPVQPRKKCSAPVLDPPYNPMGMAILNNAKRGMEYQGETGAGNSRASRMQESIEEFQKVMGADED